VAAPTVQVGARFTLRVVCWQREPSANPTAKCPCDPARAVQAGASSGVARGGGGGVSAQFKALFDDWAAC